MRTVERKIVGAFIFSQDGKVLLGKNVPGGVYTDAWLIPGGGIEEGEAPRDAVIREVSEETGLDIQNADIQKLDYAHTGTSEKTLKTGEHVLVSMQFTDFIIRLDQLAQNVHPVGQDDFMSPEWFDIETLKSLKLADGALATFTHLKYI